MKRVLCAAFAAGVALLCAADARAQESQSVPGATSTPPPPGPPRAGQYPVPSATTLPNGLRVVAVQIPGSALVDADLEIAGGSVGDPDAMPGIASLTASLLTRGTAHRTAKEIALAEDALGATLTAVVWPDRSEVMTESVAARFGDALGIMADAVREPAFAADEVALAKQRAVSDLTLQSGSPQTLATQVAQRALFAGPFGRPTIGTSRSISAIDRAAVAAYHRTFYRPDGAVLAIAGGLAPADAFALAAAAFGTWTAPPAPRPPEPAIPVAGAPRIVVVDQPNAGRTAIALARSAPLRGSRDWAAAAISNAILSGYSGRLNEEIRVKRGLSYGAGSMYLSGRYASAFLATTLVDHSKVPEALDVMLTTLGSLGAAPASAEELATRRTTLLGDTARGLETTGGLVRGIAINAFNGLPLDALSADEAAMNAIAPPDVARIAASWRSAPVIVLVGDSSKFIDAVRKAHPAVQVVKAADLDVTAAGLTR